MNEDMKRVLEELEQDLLDDDLLEDVPQKLKDNQTDEDDIDAILARILAETDDSADGYGETAPAFEDPDKPHISDEPVVYCNYSNDYGNDAAAADVEAEKEEARKEDKWLIALMGVASALCLGIIGVLIYWLVAFLK